MIIGIIDNLEDSVAVNIPFDFESNNLTSNIIVSENATVSPASGVTQN